MKVKLTRLLFASLVAVSCLSATACGKRVPATPEPDPSAPADAAPPPGQDPGAAPPPAQPGPGLPAPLPAEPAPMPPIVAPDPGAPAPGQPTQPIAPPPGSAPVNPAPGQPAPPAPPAAGNPAVDEFFARLAGAGFPDANMVKAEVQKVTTLNVTGWALGGFENPDKNVESKFLATKALFATPPATPAEYFDRSMKFATQTSGNFSFYVDLKVSSERKDLYIMKHDNDTKQIIGVNEKDLEYQTPELSAQSRLRRLNVVEGKIFFYAEERGQFMDPKRFVAVPGELFGPQLNANRVLRPVVNYSVPRYR